MIGAIIGGTGFYTIDTGFFDEYIVETKYGPAIVFTGKDDWDGYVFIPRHGPDHLIPPHRVNYRANIEALHQLGIDRICATNVVGSLDQRYPPGSLVIIDQFIDFTEGRHTTFFDTRTDGKLHIDCTYPYSEALRVHLRKTGHSLGLNLISEGCYVCINGPRFATAAEVQMYKLLGGHIVGMTSVPEVILARELGIHYAGVAIVVGWEPGITGETDISQMDMIIEQTRPDLISLFRKVLQSAGDLGDANRVL